MLNGLCPASEIHDLVGLMVRCCSAVPALSCLGNFWWVSSQTGRGVACLFSCLPGLLPGFSRMGVWLPV